MTELEKTNLCNDCYDDFNGCLHIRIIDQAEDWKDCPRLKELIKEVEDFRKEVHDQIKCL